MARPNITVVAASLPATLTRIRPSSASKTTGSSAAAAWTAPTKTAANLGRHQQSVSQPQPQPQQPQPLAAPPQAQAQADLDRISNRDWARLFLGLFNSHKTLNSAKSNLIPNAAFVEAAEAIPAHDKVPQESITLLWHEFRVASHLAANWSLNDSEETSNRTYTLFTDARSRAGIAVLLRVLGHTTDSSLLSADRAVTILNEFDRANVTPNSIEATYLARICEKAERLYRNHTLVERIMNRRDMQLVFEKLLVRLRYTRNAPAIERLIWRWCKIHAVRRDSQFPMKVVPHDLLDKFCDALAEVKSLQLCLALYDAQKRALKYTARFHPSELDALRKHEQVRYTQSTFAATTLHSYSHLPLHMYKNVLFNLASAKLATVSVDNYRTIHPSATISKKLFLDHTIVNPFLTPTFTNSTSDEDYEDLPSLTLSPSLASSTPLSTNISSTVVVTKNSPTSPLQKSYQTELETLCIAIPIYKECTEAHPITPETHSTWNRIFNTMIILATKHNHAETLDTILAQMTRHNMNPNATSLAAVVAYKTRLFSAMPKTESSPKQAQLFLESAINQVCSTNLDDAETRAQAQKAVIEGVLRGLVSIKRFATVLKICRGGNGYLVSEDFLAWLIGKAGSEGNMETRQQLVKVYEKRFGPMDTVD
ncbi:hypothetical protein HDU99_003495 [Rhizoclosmatium hyalinum]|nr:hypothetical protein HDU99_003495 [Rhizoclosmatium hyalinum]